MLETIKLQGEIEAGFLPDLIQFLGNRSTLQGCLNLLSAESRGKIWFQNGILLDAQWRTFRGEEAVREMLLLRRGTFHFSESSNLPPRSMEKETVAILMDCMRSIDEGAPVSDPPPERGSPASAPASPTEESRTDLSDAPVIQETVSGSMPDVVRDPAIEPPLEASASTQRQLRVVRAQMPAYAVRKKGPRLLYLGAAAALVIVCLGGIAAQFPDQDGAADPSQRTPVRGNAVKAAIPSNPVLDPKLDRRESEPWPPLILSGIIAGGPRGGCAVLNDQLVVAGDHVDGLSVHLVKPDGIVLEYQGKTKQIPMERSNRF